MNLFNVEISLAVSAFVFAGYLFFKPEQKRDSEESVVEIKKHADPVKKRVCLETISSIWAKRVDFSIRIDELAKIWRVDVKIPEPESTDEYEFNHKEIEEFRNDYIERKSYFSGDVKIATLKILDILDKLGDCPSVVQGQNESESQMPKNAFDVLAKIPLYLHSLNAAREIIGLANEGPLMPKAIISALGHDLGKIPELREKLYSTGDHPLISVIVLNEVPSFKRISYSDEIINAVKAHHRTAAKEKRTRLDEILKEADQLARRGELGGQITGKVFDGIGLIETAMKQKKAATEGPARNESEVLSQFVYTPPAPSEAPSFDPGSARVHTAAPSEIFKGADAPAPSRQSAAPGINRSPAPIAPEDSSVEAAPDFFGERIHEEKDKLRPKERYLEWFDPAEFINELKPSLNKMYGNKWVAFSMPDGLVYVQTETVLETIKKIGRKKRVPDVDIAETDEELRKSILFSAVQHLRSAGDYIATNMIREGYFSGFFTLKMKNGAEFKKCSYVVFNAEVFSPNVSDLESTKYGKIKDIELVVPYVAKN